MLGGSRASEERLSERGEGRDALLHAGLGVNARNEVADGSGGERTRPRKSDVRVTTEHHADGLELPQHPAHDEKAHDPPVGDSDAEGRACRIPMDGSLTGGGGLETFEIAVGKCALRTRLRRALLSHSRPNLLSGVTRRKKRPDVHCMESPELWFEDFGTAKLRRGRAVVKLDANFAKVIKRGDYRVFPVPEGDCHGLYVRRKSANSFEVRELMGGKSNVTFSYRIVGRRKDIKGQHRFAKVDALRRVPPRARAARSAQRVKIPQRAPARLRAFAARMEKQAEAQMSKRARKRKRSAR